MQILFGRVNILNDRAELMNNVIARYLSKYIELAEELINALSENLLVKTFPKGTTLLKLTCLFSKYKKG